jgi:hypothetical protein
MNMNITKYRRTKYTLDTLRAIEHCDYVKRQSEKRSFMKRETPHRHAIECYKKYLGRGAFAIKQCHSWSRFIQTHETEQHSAAVNTLHHSVNVPQSPHTSHEISG